VVDHAQAPAPPAPAAAVAAGNVGWDHVAPLGKISLAVAPNGLGEAEVAAQRQQLISAADKFLTTIAKRGYRMPLESESNYVWGSNGAVLNAAVVTGAAYYFTKDAKYANGVVDCLDYILGRNPLAFSYVSGYGEHAMKNPHHRVWAHQKDARLPHAPPGAVSGGPNSMLQDPYIRKLGMGGCPPQTCYVDNLESYSTNEVAINWNASLAWAVAVLDDAARAGKP
jgi:endoglucanase